MKATGKIIAATAAAAGVIGGAGYGMFHCTMHRKSSIAEKLGSVFNKVEGEPFVRETDPRAIWFAEQPLEIFNMKNPKGFNLKAYLLRAKEPSDVYVFASHGYRGDGKNEFQIVAKYYHEKGYNLFIVDHQAAGGSEGTYIGFGHHEARDGMLWLEFMKETFGKDIQIILHGVSMGSATVMLMSGNEDLPENVKFTVADCGYTSVWDELAHNFKNVGVPTFPVLNAANFFNKLVSGYDFKETSPKAAVSKARIPMLFIHGGKDDFVPTYMGSQLYAFCGSEHKELYIAPTAAHTESYPFHSEECEARINSFAEKYITK